MAPDEVVTDDGGVRVDAERPQAEASDDEKDDVSYLFDDAYWDDAFDTLYDPCMRVCSVFGC